jgi:hypothetical protein
MQRRWIPMVAIGALFVSTGALAQLYKCKGPDGKTVYSDTRCEAADKGALKVTPNYTTPSEREIAEAAEKAKAAEAAAKAKSRAADAAADSPPPSSSTSISSGGGILPYELSRSDRDRIRELELTGGSLGAYPEQKSAARMEIAHIRRGSASRLSGDERERRDSLTADLSSTDAKKRSRALDELRTLYDRW